MLTDWPPGPEEQKVSMRMSFGFDLHVHILGLGQHGHGHRRGMHAALRLRLRNTLHAVDAALPLHLGVDALALDDGYDLLVSAHAGLGNGEQLDLPAVLFREALVHAEDLGGKQRGLVAAGAGANFENDVLLVVGILGQQQHLDLFFQGRFARGERGNLFLGHGPHLRIGHHGAGFRQRLAHLLQFAVLHHRSFQDAERLARLLVLFAVVDYLGQRELGGKLLVALLHLF